MMARPKNQSHFLLLVLIVAVVLLIVGGPTWNPASVAGVIAMTGFTAASIRLMWLSLF